MNMRHMHAGIVLFALALLFGIVTPASASSAIVTSNVQSSGGYVLVNDTFVGQCFGTGWSRATAIFGSRQSSVLP